MQFLSFLMAKSQRCLLDYFKKWSFSSNPFQYLIPHYLDIIFRTISPKVSNINSFKISGNILDKKFSSNKNLSSFVSEFT